MRAKVWLSLAIIIVLISVPVLYILEQNTFDMEEKTIKFDTPQGMLTGTLTLPKQYSGKLGLVLFIHGDGAINASYHDGYKPLWERLASLGYASLSLNKRGIGESEGHWLDQSIDDRVLESQKALAWARKQPMIDDTKMGVWGASQAGWVIPKLAGKEQLAFSILVSPAINWLSQGEYNTRSQMSKDGHTQEEIEQQLAYESQINDILRAGSSYDEYVKIAHRNDIMPKERWNFVSKNYTADATEDLNHFKSPVLLLLGDHDVNVDYKETERVYRENIHPSLLTVKLFSNTEHSMLSVDNADSKFRTTLISLFAPRSITVEGYMDQIERFLFNI